MNYIKEDFKCPNCNKKFIIKIYKEVSEDVVPSIITRDFFKQVCPHCKNEVITDYELNINTPNYYIYYTPMKDSDKPLVKDITRVCDTYDDLKEKILIFEDGLNDILVEFLKMYIKNELKTDDRFSLKCIRYDSKNEDNLIFSLVGDNQNIGIPITMYDKLYSKCKFKKIKKGIVIDNSNYYKYFKLVS